MTTPGRLAIVVAWVASLAVTPPAIADDSRGDNLARTRAALDASDYSGARTALTEALASGTNAPDQLVEIYRLTGIVAGSLGDAASAKDAFTRLLLLAPKATLPAKISTRISDAFEAARAAVKTQEPLRVKLETSAGSITLVVASDPLGMIARAHAIILTPGQAEQTLVGTGTVRPETRAIDRITIALPANRRLELRVAALDQHGNHLIELGTADVPIVIIDGKQTPVTPKPGPKPGPITGEKPLPDLPPIAPGVEAPRPIYARWWLWSGLALGFAGTGAIFAYAGHTARRDLEALNADSTNHTFTEATALESRLSRDVLITNLAFGAAGVAAIVAGVVILTGPRARARETRSTTIRPAPIRGGGGITLEVPF